MSLVSYHGGHSGEYCCHARDTKEELVDAYREKNFESFALTEHLPPPDDTFLYPDEVAAGFSASSLQMRIDELFFEEAPRLKQKHPTVNLFVGFETEFYGMDPLAWIEECYTRYNPDIIVASLHHVHSIPIDYSEEHYLHALTTCGGLEALYRSYFRQQRELFEWLQERVVCPVIVGHLDLIKIFAQPPIELKGAEAAMIRENIQVAVDAGFIFEINARGFKKGLGEPYPSVELIREIVSLGGHVTFGDDSHAVEEVGLYYPKLAELLDGIVEEYTVLRRDQNGLPQSERKSYTEFKKDVLSLIGSP